MKVKELKELIKGKDDDLTIWIPNWDYGEFEPLGKVVDGYLIISKEKPEW